MTLTGLLYAAAGALLVLLARRALFPLRRPDGATDQLGFLGPGEEILEGFDRRTEDGIGYVLVRRADGRIVLVVIDDDNREIPGDTPGGVSIIPAVAGRSEAFGGTVVDLERLFVPDDRLPEGLGDPLPPPGPSGELSPALLAERRRRLDEQRREGTRYVVITQEQGEGGPVCVIRVFDGDGTLISVQRKDGAFVKAVANKATGEKTVVTRASGGLLLLQIDVVEGAVRGDLPFALDGGDDVRDFNVVAGRLLVFDQLLTPPPPRVRVRVFVPPDPRPVNVLEIPGTLATPPPGTAVPPTLTNGRTVKSVVTQFEGRVYNDLVDAATGRRLTGADAQGLAQNPITGTFEDHQVHRVGDADRFLAAAYAADRDETEVRILDGAGRIVGTVVLPGRFGNARVRGDRKEFVSHRRDGTPAVTRVDLGTGLVVS
jgi:hypothetical protein